MSYSLNARGATIAAALAALAADFDAKVLPHQPIHKRDRNAALAAAEGMTRQLGEQPAGHDVVISLHGSMGWSGTYDPATEQTYAITSCSVGATAGFQRQLENPA